jgi:short-subunit dehydrogenase
LTPERQQRAIVTGASRGIGAAIAIALADSGVVVACVARTTDSRPGKISGTIDATVRLIRSRRGGG